MDIFRPLEEILDIFQEDFDPSIAPWRYHKIRESLENDGNLGFLGAIAIHGLRRTGKTLAAVNIGKLALEKGYRVLYTNLDDPLFDPEGDAMKKGTIIKEAVEISKKYGKEKLLVIVDEAFIGSVRIIHSFLDRFKGIYDRRAARGRRDFGVILLGSYGIDVERLRAYIHRTISPKGLPPIIISTPRICRRHKKKRFIDILSAFRESPESPIREYVIAELLNKGILSNGYLGNDAMRVYREYENTLGMPEVIKRVKTKEEAIGVFSQFLEESIARFKSIVKASKDEEIKYSKVTYQNVLKYLKSIVGYRKPKKYDDFEIKLTEFVLNLGIVIPRRYIEPNKIDKKSLNDIYNTLNYASLGELLESFGIQPTPAHLFGYLYLERITKKKSPGIMYESIVAHCLIRDAIRRYSDVTLTRLPILSTKGIDFLYLYNDPLGDYDPVLFEVKSGKEITKIINEGVYKHGAREELDKALETAKTLRKPLTIVTPDADRFYIGRKYIQGIIDGIEVPIYVVPIEAFVAMACYTRA